MNDTMRCKTCKHRSKYHFAWDRTGLRKCLAIREAWEVEKDPYKDGTVDQWDIGHEEDQRLKAEAFKKAKAVAQDGSSYSASIMTTEDFGCVLWEKDL